jgi:hypothetical protein
LNNPTEFELRESIPHLAFEFYHFQLFARRDFQPFFLDRSCSQAFGYAFLIHLRTLLEFFYTTKGRPDDLLAADFRTVFQRFPEVQGPTDWNVKEVKDELGKRLAHLTAHRWRRKIRPEMDFYDRCVPAVSSLITVFRDALPPEFQARLNDEMSRLVYRFIKI